MHRDKASPLSSQIASYYPHLGLSQEDANAINTAVFFHACTLLPEPDAAIVTEYADGAPVLLIAHESKLIAVFAQPDEEGNPASTSQRVYPLDPKLCTIQAEKIKFGGSRTFGLSCSTTWHVEVEDFELTFTGRIHEDGTMDEKAAFGRQIAAQLGWSFAEDSQTLQQVA